MERFLVALLVTVSVSGPGRTVSADDTDVTAILDKAMKALGGEDKLSKIEAATWKAKGKITLGDNKEHEFTGQTTTQGLDRFRSELEVEFLDGTKLKFLSVLNGDKAWHTVGDMALYPDAAVARLKRTVYLAVIPVTLAPLKGPGFKVQAAGEEKVGGRPAVVLKVTCPDGKDITISFDKESGLPVKAVGKVFTLDGREVTQETTYGDYKDFGGIKIATRIEFKIDGKPDRKQEVTEFKVLDKVDPLAFATPEEAAGFELSARHRCRARDREAPAGDDRLRAVRLRQRSTRWHPGRGYRCGPVAFSEEHDRSTEDPTEPGRHANHPRRERAGRRRANRLYRRPFLRRRPEEPAPPVEDHPARRNQGYRVVHAPRRCDVGKT